MLFALTPNSNIDYHSQISEIGCKALSSMISLAHNSPAFLRSTSAQKGAIIKLSDFSSELSNVGMMFFVGPRLIIPLLHTYNRNKVLYFDEYGYVNNFYQTLEKVNYSNS